MKNLYFQKKNRLRLVELVHDEIVMEHNYWISQDGWRFFRERMIHKRLHHF